MGLPLVRNSQPNFELDLTWIRHIDDGFNKKLTF